jgi:hypothetical protein
MASPNNVEDQGAAEAAPSPLWCRAPDTSDFGPCYQAIDCGSHFHAVQVVVNTTDGKDHPLEPVAAAEERIEKILLAGNHLDHLVFALKQIAEMAPGSKGAYQKFSHAQNIASRVLRDAGISYGT